jgi:uncharacterized damage-inducible protein DinB
MFEKLDQFLKTWEHETGATQRILSTLTDEALAQPVAEGHRTAGQIAWHLAVTIPEMLKRTGLQPEGPEEDAPVPATASEIAETYQRASASLTRQLRELWSDETLQVEDDMYGMPWKRGFTLAILVSHETHHRGQLTVLMRQAGLRVPGVCGPAREEWGTMGMEPPPW